MFFGCPSGNLVTVQFIHLLNDLNVRLSGSSVLWLRRAAMGPVPSVGNNCSAIPGTAATDGATTVRFFGGKMGRISSQT